MTTISTVPDYYDAAFIYAKAGVTNHFGPTDAVDGFFSLRYRGEDFDAVLASIESYPVAYRSAMVPGMLARTASLRDERVRSFSFGPYSITLNEETKANLTGAAMGLQLDPTMPGIDWAISKDTFVFIDRDTMIAMAIAAFRHVQKCFTAQHAIAEEIMAAPNIEVLRAMDLPNHEAWSV